MSAWGESWGTSWGNSWGGATSVVVIDALLGSERRPPILISMEVANSVVVAFAPKVKAKDFTDENNLRLLLEAA